MNKSHQNKVVIVGGSMAGLMAAKAVAPYYKEVYILEKDQLIDKPLTHKSVPQGFHAHTLLKSGEEALEQLFPGIRNELIDAGSIYVDFGTEVLWKHHGSWKTKLLKPYKILTQSRPFLEWMIRKKLLESTNVQILEETKVVDIKYDPSNGEVSEVNVMTKGALRDPIKCDLLIDASGAGSKASKWLEQGNYKSPKESKVKIDLAYTSRNFKCPKPFDHNYKSILTYFCPSQPTRTGLIFSTETDEIVVSLGGYGNHPPKKEEDFLSYAKQMESPEIYNVIKSLDPASSTRHYKFPEQRRKHFERLKQFPSNLLVMGDAFCRFDPVYGQGMSVAAKEAIALSKIVEHKKTTNLARTFHKTAAKIVATPWLLTSLEGFRMKHTTGKKPLPVGMKIAHWYFGHLFHVTALNSKTYTAFFQVINLQKNPALLFKPSIIYQVIKRSFSQALSKA